jgi:hypothetical protein
VYLNPWLYAAFTALAAAFVAVDAGLRRRREVDSEAEPAAGGEDDWSYATPSPLRWTLLVLAFAPAALPAYFVRLRRLPAAAVAVAVGVAAALATFKVSATYELRNPLKPNKTVPWSRFPPGLAAEVRKATEALTEDLATRVIDVLPGLVDIGRSYPGGAEISVKPGETEARVLMEINSDDFVIMTALRIFADRGDAAKLIGSDKVSKAGRSLDLAGGRRGTLLGPKPQPDGGAGSDHYLELYEGRGGMVSHIFVQERGAGGTSFTETRRAALVGAALDLSAKLAAEVQVSD